MIKWKLRAIMSERKITNKILAEATGLTPVTISRLRNTDHLQQISGDALERLCLALQCEFTDLMSIEKEKTQFKDLKFLNCDLSDLMKRIPNNASNEQPSSDDIPIYALG